MAVAYFVVSLFLMFTIVGIPFGKQHFKLAEVALTPFNYNYARQERERDL